MEGEKGHQNSKQSEYLIAHKLSLGDEKVGDEKRKIESFLIFIDSYLSKIFIDFQ